MPGERDRTSHDIPERDGPSVRATRRRPGPKTVDPRYLADLEDQLEDVGDDYFFDAIDASLLFRRAYMTTAIWRLRGQSPPFEKVNGRVFYRASVIRAFRASSMRTSTSDPGSSRLARVTNSRLLESATPGTPTPRLSPAARIIRRALAATGIGADEIERALTELREDKKRER